MAKLIAFDTSTERLSIALTDGARVWRHEAAGGAAASQTLLPRIQAMLEEAGLVLAELDAIAFGQGPGSFTGLRTACAVAQGLSFGSGVPLLPVPSLLALAEQAWSLGGGPRIAAALDARMNQIYFACHDLSGDDASPWASPVMLIDPPELAVPDGYRLAGNLLAPGSSCVLPADTDCLPAVPDAAAMLRLAPVMLDAGLALPPQLAAPLYVRDKVALTSAERAEAGAGRP